MEGVVTSHKENQSHYKAGFPSGHKDGFVVHVISPFL